MQRKSAVKIPKEDLTTILNSLFATVAKIAWLLLGSIIIGSVFLWKGLQGTLQRGM